MFYVICGVLLAPLSGIALAMFILNRIVSPKRLLLSSAHVMITGGSSGIGKAVAVEVVKRGASVSLLARDERKLNEAKEEIEKFMIDKEKQKVVCISLDVSKDYIAVEEAVHQAESELGTVDMLVNSAGLSVPGRFEDLPVEDFKRMMDVNYLGTVFATRAVVRQMKARRLGRIVLISSQAGQLGLFGYTAYSASKFALRGFAEALQMELKPFNIQVCLSFPPDTDTPMLRAEMEIKPEETKLISDTSGVYDAEYVARKLVADAVDGNFLSYVGLDGYLLSSITAGMSPVFSILDAVQQVLTMSLFRAVSFCYLFYFYYIVKNCQRKRDQADQVRDRNK